MPLVDRFRRFAKECRGTSPLYETLALGIADHEGLLRVASNARDGQPVPNLFLGAVHYSLLSGVEHPLRDYYSSLTENPLPSDAHVMTLFEDFCSLYEFEINEILQTKRVQTNEVRRCAYLYPSFCSVYKRLEKPLALIELGTSAGFQLLWDRYAYEFNDVPRRYGFSEASLHLKAQVDGPIEEVLQEKAPPVLSRVGVDLHVNDVANRADRLWLEALIWPEHADRRALFAQAVQCIEREQSLTLIEVEGVECLRELVQEISKEAVVCVFHTHVANQMSEKVKRRLLDEVRHLGRTRDIVHL